MKQNHEADWFGHCFFFPRQDQERDCSIWKRDLAPQTMQDVLGVQVPETTAINGLKVKTGA